MIGEVVEVVRFIHEMLVLRRSNVQGWRAVYDLYRKLGTVIDRSVTAVEHYLPVPMDAPFLVNTRSFPSPVAKWVTVTNEDFERLDEAVKDFLDCLPGVSGALEIYDEELAQRVRYHFAVKAIWCRRFSNVLQSGQVTSDGRRLHKKALKLANRITDDPYAGPSEQELRNLLVEAEYDLSTEAAKQALISEGRKNIAALQTIRDDLAAFIRKNAKIEDLL